MTVTGIKGRKVTKGRKEARRMILRKWVWAGSAPVACHTLGQVDLPTVFHHLLQHLTC